jgi:fructokinase
VAHHGDEAASVLVIGEALVDIVETDAATTEHPGGSPANVALGLSRMGVPVELLTWLAHDARGDLIATHLVHSGVRIAPASFGAGRTPTARARLRPDGSAAYEFDIAWDVPPIEPPTSLAAVHTGSIGAFAAPGAAKVADLLRRTDAPIVSFDPNVRPALMPPHDEAVASFEAMCGLATLVKLSDEDAQWLWPDVAPPDVLARILALGPRVAAITLGGEGAALATADAHVRVPAVPVEVADTIGAGDTFMASLIASAVAHADAPLTREALTAFGERAVRAAAITVSRPGADLPWARELD